MPNITNPAGFDVATVLAGSGLTLLLSAAIMRYGDQFQFTPAELYGISGAALAVAGVVLGLLFIAMGYR